MIVKTTFSAQFLHHRLTSSIAMVDNSSARVRDLLKSCIGPKFTFTTLGPSLYIHIHLF